MRKSEAAKRRELKDGQDRLRPEYLGLLEPWQHACDGKLDGLATKSVEAMLDSKRLDELKQFELQIPSSEQLLCQSVRKGLLGTLSVLLDRGVSANALAWRRLALSHAAEMENIDAMEMLCARGALMDGQVPVEGFAEYQADSHGENALIVAAYHGKERAARWLIENGATVDLADGRKLTPLHWCAISNKPIIARMLIEAGADLWSRDKQFCIPLGRAAMKGWGGDGLQMLMDATGVAGLSDKDMNGDTPAHLACRGGLPAALQMLILAGSDLKAVNNSGRACLDLARERGWSSEFLASVERLALTRLMGADGMPQDDLASLPSKKIRL